jgi:hypothetical protein
MKKKIATALIIIMLVSSQLWAFDFGPGPIGMASGGVAIGALGFFMEEPANFIFIGLGAALIAGSLWWAWSEPGSFYAKALNNEVIQRVVFNATTDKVTMGARFKIK